MKSNFHVKQNCFDGFFAPQTMSVANIKFALGAVEQIFAPQSIYLTNIMYAQGAAAHTWLDGQLSPLFNSGWLPQAPNPD